MTWQAKPPTPLPPKITAVLIPGTGQTPVDITGYLSQETAPLLTTTIESPTTTNNFTAADVSLKGYDPTGYIKGLLAGILPTSLDYTVSISLAMPGSDTGSPSTPAFQTDAVVNGIIQPATVQFNQKDKSFSFTLLSNARLLQSTSAVSLFKRLTYSDTKWTLYQDASPKDAYTIRITTIPSSSNGTCEFLAGDSIQLAGAEEFVITGIAPDPAQSGTSPGAYWEIGLATPLQKTYAIGAAVVLTTPYQRNLTLQSVVTALFNAAGFTTMGYFAAPPLPGISTLFATPIPPTGLPVGAAQGIAPGYSIEGSQNPLFVGTGVGLYRAPDAVSAFSLLNAASTGPPIDDTNIQAGYIFQNAPKRTKSRTGSPRFGVSVVYKYYAYDGKFYGGTFNRYCLTVTCNADVDAATFSFSAVLSWETQNSATYVWTTQGTLQTLSSGTTTTDLSRLYDAIGIEVDSFTGTCFFTDLQNVSGAGTAITMNTSAWQPTGATIATGTYQANKATGVNGPIVMLLKGDAGGPTFVGIAQVDGILGKSPTFYVYTVVANGTMTQAIAQICSPYLIGRSIKFNRGDRRYYGLVSDPSIGISIISWSQYFAVDALSTPILLRPPPPNPSQATALVGRPYEVDLIVLQNTGAYGSGQFPMVGFFGGSLYSISKTFTAAIEYADMTGLSVADALQQLSLLNAGIFYVKAFGLLGGQSWVFRSRSLPVPGDTIGANDQIDDPAGAGMLSLVQQNVFNRWVGYVRFENENDQTIFGEAGNSAFQDTDQGLTLKSRFITSPVNAAALALSLFTYLGASKRWIEIERIRDGRTYECGRTFHAYPDGYGIGTNRTFQIIETGHPVTGATVKVVGLEV